MFQLYTDGACSPNPGLGGWGCCFYLRPEVLEKHCGYLEDTTNNVMEITAVIRGLQAISQHGNYINMKAEEVEIFTDSQYVVNTMTKGWKRNKNIELWNELDKLIALFGNVKWTWVKGHAFNLYNNMCDELAVNARTNKISY